MSFEKTEILFLKYNKEYDLKMKNLGLNEVLDSLAENEKESSWVEQNEKSIADQLDKEYNNLIAKKEYFYGCPFEIYHSSYNARLKDFLSEYPDANESDFILIELNHRGNLIFGYAYEKTKKNISFSEKKRNKFLEERINNLGYSLEFAEDWGGDGTWYYDIKESNINSISSSINTVKWTGTQVELVELIKSLIESKKVQGTQKEIINSFSKFFNIEINNPNKTIQDIKNRNNDSETLFLDKLKSNLLNFIKGENIR